MGPDPQQQYYRHGPPRRIVLAAMWGQCSSHTRPPDQQMPPEGSASAAVLGVRATLLLAVSGWSGLSRLCRNSEDCWESSWRACWEASTLAFMASREEESLAAEMRRSKDWVPGEALS